MAATVTNTTDAAKKNGDKTNALESLRESGRKAAETLVSKGDGATEVVEVVTDVVKNLKIAFTYIPLGAAEYVTVYTEEVVAYNTFEE